MDPTGRRSISLAAFPFRSSSFKLLRRREYSCRVRQDHPPSRTPRLSSRVQCSAAPACASAREAQPWQHALVLSFVDRTDLGHRPAMARDGERTPLAHFTQNSRKVPICFGGKKSCHP